MCGAAGMIGLTVLQGINQYNAQRQQYNAQAAMYNAQATAAENNARISQRKQEQIAEQYANQQRKLNDRMRLAAGQTAAQAGASGLQLSGSPLDLLSSSYSAWHDDSNTLLSNQRNDVWSERLNEINYTNQANAYRASAANIRSQKNNALWGTLLSTGASIYGINRMYGSAAPMTSASLPPYQSYYTFGTPGKNGISTYMNSGLFGSTPGTTYKIKYPWSR